MMEEYLYNGILDACNYWNKASILQENLKIFIESVRSDSDSCIDCSKALIEVFCRIIIENIDPNLDPYDHPNSKRKGDIGVKDYFNASIRCLGIDYDDHIVKSFVQPYVSWVNKIHELRNSNGILSHGKKGFENGLNYHDRRFAVIMTDAIISFLHDLYMNFDIKKGLKDSREEYGSSKINDFNRKIDANINIISEVIIDDEGKSILNLGFILPSDETISFSFLSSQLLYIFDRDAYIEALNAAEDAQGRQDSTNE